MDADGVALEWGHPPEDGQGGGPAERIVELEHAGCEDSVGQLGPPKWT
jgi:hypothetical protein